MKVSIFSDASWCPDSKVAGWGAWAKSERGESQACGPLKSSCASSNDAEAMALANAVHIAFSRGIASEGDTLVIRTDSAHTIWMLSKKGKPGSAEQAAVKQWMRETCARRSITLHILHVKGHRRKLGGRHLINAICDKLARSGLKSARKEIGFVRSLLPQNSGNPAETPQPGL